MKNQSIKEAITVAVKQIFEPELLGKWVSMREHPIGNILRNAGVGAQFYPAVIETLKDLHCVTTEGNRVGFRYKFTDIMDSESVADKVLLKYDELREENSKRKLRKKYSLGKESGERNPTKAERILTPLPKLTSKVYVMYSNQIHVGIVSGLNLSGDNSVQVTVRVYQKGSDDFNVAVYQLSNVHQTLDQLIKKLKESI